jgi:hypothetical protein
MALAALGGRTHSIGRNSIGRTAAGASNDNFVVVVHYSKPFVFYG